MSDLSFPDPHPLDAVIWQALTSIQKDLAEGDGRARRYPASIAPFAATIDMAPASFRSLLALVGGSFFIVLEKGRRDGVLGLGRGLHNLVARAEREWDLTPRVENESETVGTETNAPVGAFLSSGG